MPASSTRLLKLGLLAGVVVLVIATYGFVSSVKGLVALGQPAPAPVAPVAAAATTPPASAHVPI